MTDNTVYHQALRTGIPYCAYSRAAHFTACSCTDKLNYILGTHPSAVTSQAAFQMDLHSALGMADAATWELWKQHAVILLLLLHISLHPLLFFSAS